MNLTIRDLQARVNAIFNQPVLVVDGMNGPNTRKGVAAAMKERRVRKPQELVHDSGLHRIIWHWTAGTYTDIEGAIDHYNDVFDKDGNHYDGRARPEHQANYDWRKKIGVSHTLNSNTGNIGMAVAAMAGADGWPTMEWGKYPLTWEGIDAMLKRTAYYSEEFDIPVTPWSILSHAEVEPTLGIKQRNKWDIRILPGMDAVREAREIGDMLRDRMKVFM